MLATRTTSNTALPEQGRLIDSRFRVLALLGEGGMCSVYRVKDESQGTLLALKLLRLGSEADRLRFRREFHTLANLRHPGIVRVYEYGLDEQSPFYTMELLEGQDLSEVGTLPTAQALRVLRDVAETLAFIHSRRLVHRDLTLRNVRLDEQGRARLMDFGILATTGVTGEVAGTPPYVAPETLRQQPQDQRTDLYSLGALAWRLLTGHHAYPARTMEQLEALWSRPLPPPSKLRAELPPELDALVLSLLSMDPQRRPRSAAEVVDRLDALLGERRTPVREVAAGYLTHTVLVGRQREMALFSQCVEQAAEGRGVALLVEGEPGSGRSRMLRELGLEAQVMGATSVQVRAEPGAQPYAYALAQELGRALFIAAPEDASSSAQGLAPVLARLPGLAKLLAVEPAPSLPSPVEDRLRLLGALADWLLAFASRRPLVVLVDDAHAADEPSTALLLRLAGRASSGRLVLALSISLDRRGRTLEAIAALQRLCLRVHLHPLEEPEVEELLRSTFGEGPTLKVLARWLYRGAHGLPLHTLELARHLVERGVVRYLEGLWLVDGNLESVQVLPELVDAFGARLARLSPAARALAEALAVHESELTLELCVAVAGEPDEEAVFSRLDELMRAEVLVGGNAAYRFRHPLLREALLRPLPAKRLAALHHAMGHALLRLGLANTRQAETGWHLLRGGEELAGAELLADVGCKLFDSNAYADAMAPLEAAVEIYERARVKPSAVLDLLFRITFCGSFCRWEVLRRHAPRAVERFHAAAGLPLARRLRPLLGSALGLLVALGLKHVAWRLTPRSRRSMRPTKALMGFGMVLGALCTVESMLNDVAAMERLLVQGVPLSALRRRPPYATWLYLRNMVALARGEWAVVEQGSQLVLEDRTLWGPRHQPRLRPLQLVSEAAFRGLQLIQMALLRWQPELFQQELAAMNGLGVQAMEGYVACLRAAYHRQRGEEERAVELDTRAELAFLELGVGWGLGALRARYCALSYALTRDVLGLKRTVEELGRLVQQGSGHQELLALTRGEYHRERGELAEAEAALRLALELSTASRGLLRQGVLAALAETHLAQGELAQALERAREAVALGDMSEAKVAAHAVRAACVLAQVEAASGEGEAAARRLREALEECARRDNPLLEGLLHEALVEVARQAGDTQASRQHRHELERCFGATGNPALLARLRSLPGSADSAGPRLNTGEQGAMSLSPVTALSQAGSATSGNEEATLLADRAGGHARAARALEVLVGRSGAAAGYLYLGQQGRLELAAPTHGDEPPAAVVYACEALFRQAAAAPLSSQVIAAPEPGQLWHLRTLKVSARGQTHAVGVAALADSPAWYEPPPRLLEELALELWRSGDATTRMA